MATALRHACATFVSFAARWGGDEFVMMCAHGIGNDPARVAGVVKARLADQVREGGVAYDLACGVGYAWCDSPEQTVDNPVAEADRMLYDAKR